MLKIPVIVVDDSDADRYIARRVLDRADGFEQLPAAETGDAFLQRLYTPPLPVPTSEPPLLVLMDINMPGRNGFETVEALQDQMRKGNGPDSIVVMMCSSSAHPRDKARASSLNAVQGYLTKPLDEEGLAKIRALYKTRAA